ncbi:hypothetical protein TrVE_jg6396 [Triparma verrucosa]|uniref:subtilisin n=1 Tax=Triparma verrucosa TaxID=1606542 RepID=A0A9W7CKA5_9STRA|nr:hypothetical protein TrVE_jg6396 [Triparma verrucosa]
MTPTSSLLRLLSLLPLLTVLLTSSTVTATPVTLTAHLRQSNLTELESTFWAIADPTSPLYLKHLSLPELAELIGASCEDIDAAAAFFKKAGGYDITVSNLRDTVTASFDSKPDVRLTSRGLPHESTHPDAVEFLVRQDVLPPSTPPLIPSAPPRTSAGSDSSPSYTISNIKDAYGIPTDYQASHPDTTQMVWGPGTFGYSKAKLEAHKIAEAPLINMDKIEFWTENHGTPGGDNFGEGQLDVDMISSFGLNVTTLVANTNTSASTEETTGFGAALLNFLTDLSSREEVPHVLSMSLGSLSSASCNLLCSEAAKTGIALTDCQAYISEQRQVCMYLSDDQTARINTALQVLGARGVTVMGSSGDGGSHFSFGPFQGSGDDAAIADALNEVSCKFQMPVFPTASPYVLSIGGEMWEVNSKHPVTWAGYGGGSGAGFSIQFEAPPHQQSSTTVSDYLQKPGMPPASSFNAKNRAYPDMSAVGVMGTSQSCPISAGIWSLITDIRLNKGLPPLGFVAPRLWQVAEEYPGEAFEDIIGGDSNTSCSNGFPATDGWDANTGFGRPIWDGFVKHFADDDVHA